MCTSRRSGLFLSRFPKQFAEGSDRVSSDRAGDHGRDQLAREVRSPRAVGGQIYRCAKRDAGEVCVKASVGRPSGSRDTGTVGKGGRLQNNGCRRAYREDAVEVASGLV